MKGKEMKIVSSFEVRVAMLIIFGAMGAIVVWAYHAQWGM